MYLIHPSSKQAKDNFLNTEQGTTNGEVEKENHNAYTYHEEEGHINQKVTNILAWLLMFLDLVLYIIHYTVKLSTCKLQGERDVMNVLGVNEMIVVCVKHARICKNLEEVDVRSSVASKESVLC